jgi:hypothetical protein
MRRIPWWAWTLAALVVAVGIVAAVGGFRDVPIQKVRTIPLGSVFHGRELDTRVLGARIVTTAPRGAITTGGPWLEIDVDTTNTSDAPVPRTAIDLRTIVTGAVGPTDEPSSITGPRGGYPPSLQPGVRTRLSFLWALGARPVHAGDRVVVGLFEETPVDDAIAGGVYSDPEVRVRLQFTIGDAA